MKRLAWGVVVLLSLGGSVAVSAGDAATLLTQGKLDVDMGDRAAAAAAFEAVANDAGAPSSLRAEALIRLGLVRRDAGDEKRSAEAFARVWKDYRQDKDAVAQLVRALGGAVPGQERWDEIWQKVVVVIETDRTGRPSTRIEWPGVDPHQRQPADPAAAHRAHTGSAAGIPGFEERPRVREEAATSRQEPGPQPITLDFMHGNLQDIFRLFADISGLNVVVHPGIKGEVSFQCKDLPWEDALDRMLAPNGLAYSLTGPVLEIARPQDLPPPRRFEGKATNVDFQEVGLREALGRIAKDGGRSLVVPPGVAGAVTFKLNGVPWDQAFDLVARLNGLTWEDEGKMIRVGLGTGGR
jgi:hypothetical protein